MFDDTFKDDPDEEIVCPHCGQRWERRTIEPGPFNETPLYDWNTTDAKHAYTTREVNNKPVCEQFCYACVYETAHPEDFKLYVEDAGLIDDFREWSIGL